jgi:hypothetical protein
LPGSLGATIIPRARMADSRPVSIVGAIRSGTAQCAHHRPRGVERTVAFTLDDAPAVIAGRVRETVEGQAARFRRASRCRSFREETLREILGSHLKQIVRFI